MTEFVVLGSLLFVAYTYFGYPILLWCWASLRNRGRDLHANEVHPSLSVLISAHNEESSIRETLHSILQSDLNGCSLEILLLSDGSTDRTVEKARSLDDPRLKVVSFDQQRGKKATLMHGSREAQGDILVFTDAGVRFRKDSLRTLLRGFSDPQVGSVVGRKRIVSTGSSISKGDGLYWRYESKLRSLESSTGSSWVGVEGGFFAIRRALLSWDFPADVSADSAICYRLYQKGYRNRYDPEAIVEEPSAKGMDREFRRKTRVIVRGIRATLVFWRLLNPFRHPAFFYQNLSHRIFRWLVPFALLLQFAVAAWDRTGWVGVFFYLQLAFYGLAVVAATRRTVTKSPWYLSVPQYFCTVNAAALMAWGSLARRFDRWAPTIRETSAEEEDG